MSEVQESIASRACHRGLKIVEVIVFHFVIAYGVAWILLHRRELSEWTYQMLGGSMRYSVGVYNQPRFGRQS